MTPRTLKENQPVRTRRAGPVRVAVIGCGAITREFHLPVLAGHEGVRLAALVDRDVERARELARQYGVETVLADASELTAGRVDAALLATPPSHHAPCGIDLAQRGIHIFVEKPMALTTAEAVAMVRAADAAGVVLAVGLFRRLFPCTRLLRAALDNGLLGRPLRFEAEAGGRYDWQSATLANMRKDLAGGGVLMDAGSHTLDRLLFLFPGEAEIIEYRDNALGGIESDCVLRLRLFHQGQPVEGRVELSRTRNLHNTLRVECERGTFELRPGERYRVAVVPREREMVDPLQGKSREYSLQAAWEDEPETSWYEPYRVEIDDWLDAIHTGQRPQLSGASTVALVKLIEECYHSVRPLEEPWGQEGTSSKVTAARNGTPRRVLITGASGFIGCRAAEILRLREGWEVRALVHNPANASRLARLPVEMVQADLGSASEILQAVRGCDAVVHCAIGTNYGQRRDIFAVTVEGTRKLAAAALAAGVRRFIHLSSIAVHGTDVRGVIDESTPVRPVRGDDYSESKVEAERVIAEAVRRGLSTVVLRPANVYGPYSQTFVVRPVEALKKGRLLLRRTAADAPSNTVYVDNVVEAIVKALGCANEVANGNVFTISEGDAFTCGEFYGYLARALGVDLPVVSSEDKPQPPAKPPSWRLLHWVGSWYRGGVQVATSAEMFALARRFLQTDPLGRLPRYLLERFPGLKRRLRHWLKIDRPVIYRRPRDEQGEWLEVRPRHARVSIDKARKVLGYTPAVSRERALQLTLDWARHARLL